MTLQQKAFSPKVIGVFSAVFIFFWASGFIVAKYGFPYAEPFTFLSLRFAVAIGFMFPLCCVWKAQWPRGRLEILHVLVAGWLTQTTYLTGVWYAIWVGIPTALVALIVGLQPLITGAFSRIFLGECVSRSQWYGLFLGFFGLILVVGQNRAAVDNVWGLFFCLLALVGITFGTLYQKKFCASVDVRTAVTIQNAGSLIFVLPIAYSFEGMSIEWTIEFWFALIWSVFGLSVIAIALLFILVQRGAATKVTSMIYLSPPTTALMGWIIFGETMSTYALAGLVISALGVALANKK